MPRFFVPTENFEENTVFIKGDDAYHIARALRMAVGDSVTVCDMQGREHECRLTKIRDEECALEIISTKEGQTEPPYKITLYMGYPKGAGESPLPFPVPSLDFALKNKSKKASAHYLLRYCLGRAFPYR